MNLSISGSSTALYSTFWFVEPYDILFDCGDGAAAFLLEKGHKVKYIVCSHPDRDHISGLLHFIQIYAQQNPPTILYPRDCDTFHRLKKMSEQLDPHVAGLVKWQPIGSGDRIPIRPNLYLECFANRHIPIGVNGPGNKSLSYCLVETRKKLRPEFASLSGMEIGRLRTEKGDEYVRENVTTTTLAYSGDTPIEKPTFWRNAEVLIHEATFLCRKTAEKCALGERHSILEDVIEMASHMKSLRALILAHFSCRFSPDEITEAAENAIVKHHLDIPVHLVIPGEQCRHLQIDENK